MPSVYIQVLGPYDSEWATVVNSDNPSAGVIRAEMMSVQRMMPKCRVRAVDEDGRLLDML